MNTDKTRGGRRANSGRMPVEDKKKQVYVMIKGSRVDKLGKEKIQEVMIKAIEEAFHN